MAAKRAHNDAFPEEKEEEEVLPPGASHRDWLPPLIGDTILFWKGVAEHQQRMHALRKEIETLYHCFHCTRRPLHRRIRWNRWHVSTLNGHQDFFDVCYLRCGRP